MKNILITGSAGFIGYHLAQKLLVKKYKVYGIDNFSNSYELKIKKLRIKNLIKNKNFVFYKNDIKNIDKVFKKIKIDLIFHLAAEAGVRKSLKVPIKYIEQNISNTIRVFEYAKKNKIKKIIYASSSSVYGDKGIYPSNEKISLDQPISIYGLTKIGTENIAYYYHKIFNINSIGLRFFTVFGPFGRPDMSIFIFIKSLIKGKTIFLNNYGKNFRDFTYIDDVVFYILTICKKITSKKKFYEVFNIGGEKTLSLNKLIKKLEKYTQKKTKIKLMPKVNLDPDFSLASSKKIKKFTGKNISTNFDEGLKKTISWMKSYIN